MHFKRISALAVRLSERFDKQTRINKVEVAYSGESEGVDQSWRRRKQGWIMSRCLFWERVPYVHRRSYFILLFLVVHELWNCWVGSYTRPLLSLWLSAPLLGRMESEKSYNSNAERNCETEQWPLHIKQLFLWDGDTVDGFKVLKSRNLICCIMKPKWTWVL